MTQAQHGCVLLNPCHASLAGVSYWPHKGVSSRIPTIQAWQVCLTVFPSTGCVLPNPYLVSLIGQVCLIDPARVCPILNPCLSLAGVSYWPGTGVFSQIPGRLAWQGSLADPTQNYYCWKRDTHVCWATTQYTHPLLTFLWPVCR